LVVTPSRDKCKIACFHVIFEIINKNFALSFQENKNSFMGMTMHLICLSWLNSYYSRI
jgi:hypothetical protein